MPIRKSSYSVVFVRTLAIPGNRAFLTLPTSIGHVRSFILQIVAKPTSVESVTTAPKTENVYNLSGQRVNASTTKRHRDFERKEDDTAIVLSIFHFLKANPLHRVVGFRGCSSFSPRRTKPLHPFLESRPS